MPTTNEIQPQPHSKLLSLPPELRNRIYEEVFDQKIATIDKKYRLPAILKTCRQIHQEAIGMYYASTKFEYTTSHFGYKSAKHTSLLRGLKAPYRALIPKVRLVSRGIDRWLGLAEDVFMEGEIVTKEFMDVWEHGLMPREILKEARSVLPEFRKDQIEIQWLRVGWKGPGWKVLSEIDEDALRKRAALQGL